MKAELGVAVLAALEAGSAIMEIYESGDFDVTVKGDNSPLTRADVASHEVIMKHLNATGISGLIGRRQGHSSAGTPGMEYTLDCGSD